MPYKSGKADQHEPRLRHPDGRHNATLDREMGCRQRLPPWFCERVPLSQLVPFSDWVLASTHVDPNSHLGDAVSFFLYETPKVLMLLTLVVFGVGVIRSFFTPEKTRGILAGTAGVGNVLAALWAW